MKEEENGFSKQLSREEKNTCRERESEMAYGEAGRSGDVKKQCLERQGER